MDAEISILIVDDQPDLLDSLTLTLEAAGYAVLTAADGQAALTMLQSHAVDLILADIAMPVMNGYQLYERVRDNPHWNAMPFLFLTARSLDSDIRYGKELGVDDYLTKPIQPEDLLAVVRGKLRRAEQFKQSPAQSITTPEADSSIVVFGTLQIDTHQHRVWFDEQAVRLSAREFILLEYLARRPGHLVTLQELLQATHGLSTDQAEAGTLLRPLVRSIRRKLGYATGDLGCIENVRGIGYRLIVTDM